MLVTTAELGPSSNDQWKNPESLHGGWGLVRDGGNLLMHTQKEDPAEFKLPISRH